MHASVFVCVCECSHLALLVLATPRLGPRQTLGADALLRERPGLAREESDELAVLANLPAACGDGDGE
jgi:hypothetical protein